MFATESISPKCYYSERNYGTMRNFTTELSFDDNYLTFFSTPPFFELIENSNSELEEFPIIIEFNDLSSISPFQASENVYIVDKTIYFHPDKVRFHFISENHLKQVIAKSRLVEETKLVFKYKENFRLINKASLTKINLDYLIYPNYSDTNTNNEINNDKFFNKIKGLIYAYLIKYTEMRNLNSSSPIIDEINKLLKQINTKNNPYFEIAYEQLNGAMKNYEKGLNFQEKNKESSNFVEIIDNLSNGNIRVSNIFENKQEYNLFNMIINYLINNHQNDNPLSKHEIISSLSYIKDIVSDSTKYKESFTEDINKISDRIIEKNYNLSFEDVQSSVLKNYLIYIMRGNKLEELEMILNENNISDAYLTYSFLGATTGFSSLSKFITNSIIDSKELMKEIDRQLIKVQKDIWKNNFKHTFYKNNLYSSELITTTTLTNNEQIIETQIIDKIQKIRESKVLRRFINKKRLHLRNNISVTFEEIEDDIFIYFNKNKISHIYILLRSKNNASSLEEQNSFKNNLKNLGYANAKISRINQGNFPVFFYYKVNENKDDLLSLDDKSELLSCLEFLLQK